VVAFFEKHAAQVSDVFLAKTPPFQTEESGAKFEVGIGFITAEFAGDRITAVYFSPE
jgi:hypothetical protein